MDTHQRIRIFNGVEIPWRYRVPRNIPRQTWAMLQESNASNHESWHKNPVTLAKSAELISNALQQLGTAERTLILGAGHGDDIPTSVHEKSRKVTLVDIDEDAVESFLLRLSEGFLLQTEVVISDISGVDADDLRVDATGNKPLHDRLLEQPLIGLPFASGEYDLIISNITPAAFLAWVVAMAHEHLGKDPPSDIRDLAVFLPLGKRLIRHHIAEILRLLPHQGRAVISIPTVRVINSETHFYFIPPGDSLFDYLAQENAEATFSVKFQEESLEGGLYDPTGYSIDDHLEGAVIRKKTMEKAS